MNARLDAVRRVWAERADARSGSELLYLVYLVVLGAALLGIPLTLFAATALARPDVLPALVDAWVGTRPLGVLLAGCAVAVIAGSVLGPAVLPPFLTEVFVGSDLPRRRTLGRPFARSVALGGLIGAVLGALVGLALRTGGAVAGAGPAALAVVGVGVLFLLVAAWLLGMVLAPRPRVLLALVLAVPGGVLVLTAGGAPLVLGPLGTAVMAAIGVLAVVLGVPLLERIRGGVLREQASRQENATMIATGGDLAGAAAEFRPLPSTGRRLPAIGSRGILAALPILVRDAALYLRRDAVGWLRTPGRTAAGVLGAVLGAAVSVPGLTLSGLPGVTLTAAGAMLVWWSTGAFVDGVRHGVETLGAPTLYGHGITRQLALHLAAPTLLTAAVCAFGAVVAGGGGLGAVAVVCLGVMGVLERIWAAAKGPIPLWIATPMPTAQGDASLIPQIMWHGDALWCILTVAFVLAWAQGQGVVTLVVAVAATIATLLAMGAKRIAALR